MELKRQNNRHKTDFPIKINISVQKVVWSFNKTR